MKGRMAFVLFACVALSGYFLTTTAAQTTDVRTAAQTTGVRPNGVSHETRVQPDLAGLVVENLSQGLAMSGLEVYRDGYSLTIITEEDQVVEVELPSTLDALRSGDFTSYVDGVPAYLRGVRVGPEVASVGLECIDHALDSFANDLEICINLQDNNFNAYCIVEAAATLAENTLKCIFQ